MAVTERPTSKTASRAPRKVRRLVMLLAGTAFLAGGAGGALAEHHQLHQNPAVVATVGGSRIEEPALFGRLQRAAGPETLRQMVNEELLLQFAAKKGALPTSAEVDALYAEKSRQSGFAKALQATGQTPEDVKRQLKLQLIQAKVLGQGKQITDADVQKVYEENSNPANPKAIYYRPETAAIAVIITPTEREAQQALHALQGGAELAAVAQQYSKDRSAHSGGIVGPLPKGRFQASRIPGLQDAIFGLRVGQQVGPEKLGGAWWIIRRLDKTPAVVTPFDSVKEDCRRIATAQNGLPQYSKVAEQYQAFRTGSNTQVFWPQYQDAAAR